MDRPFSILLFIGVLAAALFTTHVILQVLRRRSVLDHPNERSSHTTPTPRGGGWAFIIVLVPVWSCLGLSGADDMIGISALSGSALALAVMSWHDDLRGLSPLWRLSGQIAAVTLVLSAAPDHNLYFTGLLPPAFDSLAAGLLWVWFINLFNFMDGIDGISGIEAACIGAGVALVGFFADLQGPLFFYGLTLTAAALGFLWWNWHPAKIFLGDVGSIPLGFLSGWLLLTLSAQGQWAAALILPFYYLADATVTLMRRVLRGKRIWQAHREHFYQRAVQKGWRHSTVALIILVADLALMALAVLTTMGWIWPALLSACIVASTLFYFFRSESTGSI